MHQEHIKAILEGVIPEVKAAIAAATKPLLERIAELEARAPLKGDPGEAGKSVTVEDLQPLLLELVAALPKPIDGKSVTLDDVKPLIDDAIAALPKAVDGKDADPATIKLMVAEEVAKIPPASNGKDGAPGRDGKDGDAGSSVTVDDVAPIIAEQVNKAVALLPVAKDGAPGERGEKGEAGSSVTVDDIAPIIAEQVNKAVALLPVAKDGAPGRDGKDGVGLAGALIEKTGDLVVTLTDGTMRALGPVVGNDGAPGAPGTNGKDGVGFDDMTEELDADGRTIVRRFVRGDVTKEFKHTLPVVLDRGVWREGNYAKGDGVTWGGSFWIAQKDTATKPDTLNSDFRLAVKRGRDGKNGTDGKAGPQGPEGKPGRNGLS